VVAFREAKRLILAITRCIKKAKVTTLYGFNETANCEEKEN
jgi:hypothetical protein